MDRYKLIWPNLSEKVGLSLGGGIRLAHQSYGTWICPFDLQETPTKDMRFFFNVLKVARYGILVPKILKSPIGNLPDNDAWPWEKYSLLIFPPITCYFNTVDTMWEEDFANNCLYHELIMKPKLKNWQ